jgi:hypothetical protein
MPGDIAPRQTNTRRAGLLLALLPLAAGAALAAAPPERTAVEVLAPRYFPVWQARNVAFPFVTLDPASGLYRMYYAGSGAAQFGESAWDQWMTGLATSRDGRRWRTPDDYEPVLRPWRFATGEVTSGARRTRFDAMAAFGVSVVRAGQRHLMWYTGWNGDDEPAGEGRARPVHYRIGLAASPDGVKWTPQPGDAAGAVLGLGPEGTHDARSAGQPFVLPEGSGFRMWYEAFDGRKWRIATARSADGVAWTREGVVLEPGPVGALDELGARNPVVVKRRGRFELWYQGASQGTPGVHVLRATSEDARTWTKAAGAVELPLRGPLAAGESLHADSVLVRPDGACQVFFARQKTVRRQVTWGLAESRNFHIYSAVVNP